MVHQSLVEKFWQFAKRYPLRKHPKLLYCMKFMGHVAFGEIEDFVCLQIP